jgi:protein SMG7
MLYFIQHILVHVGDLNRYSNQIDLAKTFYQYAIQTIPCLGQPYNQIAILHEMKNPSSLLTPGQNQLITAYYYIRSIAIKVPFPLAISNLEKLFQRLKDFPITRYEQQQNDFLTLFLQIISMINLESNNNEIHLFINLFKTMIIKNFNQFHFIQMITIIMFTIHRTLGLLSRSSSSKQPDLQFDFILQLFILIIEQCLEAIQVPLSMMIIDEQHILPILYLSFAYLSNIQKYKVDLFEHNVFKQKQTMWNSLAKLLRSFGVYATNLEAPKGNDILDLPTRHAPVPVRRGAQPTNEFIGYSVVLCTQSDWDWCRTPISH